MFQQIPTVVKNLLIINVIVFVALNVVFPQFEPLLTGYFWGSPLFRPWQIITHMFMHANAMHIFFNMYALYVFGPHLEYRWGPKRFLTYYMLTGIGAFFLFEGVNYFEIQNLVNHMDAQYVQLVYSEGADLKLSGRNYVEPVLARLNDSLNTGVVGASGAVFGILLAFGMMFPNVELQLLFPPISIKAKYMVMIYGAIELVLALRNGPDDNVAHFAHLGGMLVGFILIKFWRSKDASMY